MEINSRKNDNISVMPIFIFKNGITDINKFESKVYKIIFLFHKIPSLSDHFSLQFQVIHSFSKSAHINGK